MTQLIDHSNTHTHIFLDNDRDMHRMLQEHRRGVPEPACGDDGLGIECFPKKFGLTSKLHISKDLDVNQA